MSKCFDQSIVRNFAPRSGLYNILRKEINWVPAVLRKRNKDTGTVTVTQKKTGKRMNASFRSLRTGIPALDELLETLRVSLNIRDPDAYLVLNYYANGRSTIGSHQHDFWSAILTFGASRVMLVDNRPVVLHDGDLIILGTQKHGIPKQPSINQGRVSVAVFYHPERVPIASQKVEIAPVEDALASDSLLGSTNRQQRPTSSRAPMKKTVDQNFRNSPSQQNATRMILPSIQTDLGDDPLSALYQRSENKKAQIIPTLSHDLTEDEQLAMAIYLSEVESNV